jgi:hypothetical protein
MLRSTLCARHCALDTGRSTLCAVTAIRSSVRSGSGSEPMAAAQPGVSGDLRRRSRRQRRPSGWARKRGRWAPLSILVGVALAVCRPMCSLSTESVGVPVRRSEGQLSKPACWFLHGAGETAAGAATQEFPEYWGGVHTHVQDDCSSVYFNHEDTVNQPFDTHDLRKSVCKDLCGGPGCVIMNKVIFTHSAANMYLAAAFEHGDCYLGGSSDWYLSNPPALGSAAASLAVEACEDTTLNPIRKAIWAAGRPALVKLGYCSDTTDSHGNHKATHMYLSMQSEYVAPKCLILWNQHSLLRVPVSYVYVGAEQPAKLRDGVLQRVMSKHAAGGMCGVTPGGMCGGLCTLCVGTQSTATCLKDYVGLCAIAKCAYTSSSTGLAAANCNVGQGVIATDGMVGFKECALPGRQYTSSADHQWYQLSGNHADGTCINGDGSASNERPCEWFSQMVKHSTGVGRPQKYSCAGRGKMGCVRDSDGQHDSEESCIRYCRACVPSACLNGGECVAKADGPFANAQVYEPFLCRCPQPFRGTICQDNMTDIHSANFVRFL